MTNATFIKSFFYWLVIFIYDGGVFMCFDAWLSKFLLYKMLEFSLIIRSRVS